jgi:hypothetical protein
MAREAPSRGGQFVEVGWGFHGLLVYSGVFLVLRWVMLEKVLGVGAVRSGPYLVAKLSRVGVEVDGTSCPLRRPPLVDIGLVYRVFGMGRFFLDWSPSPSLGELLSLQAHMP